MNASDVMNRKVITVMGDACLEEAARLMVEHRVGGLPVVDDRGTVTGMITEGDLMRRAETGTARHGNWFTALLASGRMAQDYVHSNARRVDELINGTVISVSPDTSLADIVATMESRRVKRLPVIENGRMVGIVARADLVRALLEHLPRRASSAVNDAQVRSRFLQELDRQQWIPRAAIDCEVKNGVIELHGLITDDRLRPAVCVIAENTAGARSVRDHMVCVEPISGGIVSQGSDSERTAA